ncbi:hypothetical protein [Oryza sativa Japonica Group]|uniref:Uncharacterized protein n=1 Tax=Oryza sativa subsp. japonica TaxID=39947 RepID=Q5QLH5_ORYSJ|nr:hypothetical protein [Oryza sativa Japonica Group]BAD73809.1 hypothetical protein [Oryza sativa Japonica Group]
MYPNVEDYKGRTRLSSPATYLYNSWSTQQRKGIDDRIQYLRTINNNNQVCIEVIVDNLQTKVMRLPGFPPMRVFTKYGSELRVSLEATADHVPIKPHDR